MNHNFMSTQAGEVEICQGVILPPWLSVMFTLLLMMTQVLSCLYVGDKIHAILQHESIIQFHFSIMGGQKLKLMLNTMLYISWNGGLTGLQYSYVNKIRTEVKESD